MTAPSARPLTVSVALCTHNGSAYIDDQVRSILAQTRQPHQIVLSDDDSGDDTVSIVESILAESDTHIELRVIRNRPALGVAANFAGAIAACSADLVALSDQDDVWHPERLEVLIARFEDDPALTLLHGDARRVDAVGAPLDHSLFESLEVSGWELAKIDAGRAMTVFVRRNLVTGATTVFRRSLADVALPIAPGWIHDEWFGIIAAATGRVGVDRRQLVDYRQHDSNQIGAAQLDLRGKVRKLREARSERNRNLYVRARELVTRLQALDGIPAVSMRLAWEKQEHERYRVSLPTNRARRLLPVLGTAVRGNYRRYGLGAKDVLRDLVQPVG